MAKAIQVRVPVGEGGQVVVQSDELIGVTEALVVLIPAEPQHGPFDAGSGDAALAALQAMFAGLRPGRSLADELIAERRAEASRA
jgi:hypothetical protein